MKKSANPIIVERPLGRERAWGLSHGGKIEIDPRQDAKKYLDTLIHEGLHEFDPKMSETKTASLARFLTRIIWEQNFRKIQTP
jgi:hypothetical protein